MTKFLLQARRRVIDSLRPVIYRNGSGLSTLETHRKVKFGMIGCGEAAFELSGKAIKDARNAEMIIAMDPVPDVARSFGERFGVPYTTKLEEVLENGEVEAVVISTPHFLHEPLTVQAAKAGKHVMCEKPIACSIDQADRMIEACREAGVFLTVSMIPRYDPATVKAKELVAQGAIGQVVGLQSHLIVHKPESYWNGGLTGRVKSDWRKYWEQSGGGILMMNLVYEVDRFRYITGLEVTRASCEYDTFCTNVAVEDYITVIYRYHNGAIGTVTAASCTHGGRGPGNRIVGTEGQIVFEAAEIPISTFRMKRLLVFTHSNVAGLKPGKWNKVPLALGGSPRQIYVERFAGAVLTGQPVDIPGEEGRKVLEATLAAYQSAENVDTIAVNKHAPTDLPQVFLLGTGHQNISI